MILLGTAALMLLGLAAPEPAPERFAQMVVRQQIIVRTSPRAPTPPVEWRERRGPKCVAARAIAGAAFLRQNSVDLVMRNQSRVRARLKSRCPALDYYHGFYITPNADGMICADRDSIRSRMGGQCQIDQFKSLSAVKG